MLCHPCSATLDGRSRRSRHHIRLQFCPTKTEYIWIVYPWLPHWGPSQTTVWYSISTTICHLLSYAHDWMVCYFHLTSNRCQRRRRCPQHRSFTLGHGHLRTTSQDDSHSSDQFLILLWISKSHEGAYCNDAAIGFTE